MTFRSLPCTGIESHFLLVFVWEILLRHSSCPGKTSKHSVLKEKQTFGRKIIPEDLGKKTFVMTILSDTEWETLKNEWIVAAIK